MNKRIASKKTIFAVYRLDNFKCVYCGRGIEDGAKLHCDHLIPYSKGGVTDISNLVTSCSDCNTSKSNKVLTPKEIYYITRNRELNYTIVKEKPLEVFKKKVVGFFTLVPDPNTPIECMATIRKRE